MAYYPCLKPYSNYLIFIHFLLSTRMSNESLRVKCGYLRHTIENRVPRFLGFWHVRFLPAMIHMKNGRIRDKNNIRIFLCHRSVWIWLKIDQRFLLYTYNIIAWRVGMISPWMWNLCLYNINKWDDDGVIHCPLHMSVQSSTFLPFHCDIKLTQEDNSARYTIKWSDRCDPINFNISYRIVVVSADHIFIIKCCRIHGAQWFQASLKYRRATTTSFNFTNRKEERGNCSKFTSAATE